MIKQRLNAAIIHLCCWRFPPGNGWNLCSLEYHAHGDVHGSIEIHECFKQSERHTNQANLNFKGPMPHSNKHIHVCPKNPLHLFHPSTLRSKLLAQSLKGSKNSCQREGLKKSCGHTFWPPLITRPSVPPESPENKRLRRAGLKSCWSATKGMVPINRTRCVGTIFNVPLKIIQGICCIIDR